MLDLEAIRARWAKATRGPWRLFFDGKGYDKHTREVTIARNRKNNVTTDWVVTNTTMGIDDARAIAAAPKDIAALLSELDRLTSELAASTRPYLILDDPEGIIGCVEATSPEAAWEAFKTDNPNDYDGDPADNDVVIERVTVAWCDKLVDGLEIARSKLAAAQAGPVVEWHPDSHGWEVAHVGLFVLKLQTGSKCAGWRLFLGDARVTDGPETGPAGKAACEAAYRRACGLTPG